MRSPPIFRNSKWPPLGHLEFDNPENNENIDLDLCSTFDTNFGSIEPILTKIFRCTCEKWQFLAYFSMLDGHFEFFQKIRKKRSRTIIFHTIPPNSKFLAATVFSVFRCTCEKWQFLAYFSMLGGHFQFFSKIRKKRSLRIIFHTIPPNFKFLADTVFSVFKCT